MSLQRLAHPQYSGDFYDAPPGNAPLDTLAPGSRNFLALAGKHKKPFKGLTHLGKGSRVQYPVKNTFAGHSDYVSGTSATVGITINLFTVTATAGVFVVGDVNKAISIAGAGPGGLTLFATITGYTSATVVTIDIAATATVASAASIFGTLVQGAGGGFSFIGNSLWYQGAGQLTLTGVDITGALASSTLKILLQRAGLYTAADSGPYSAGLTQTSAPTVSVKSSPGTGFTGLLDGVYSFKFSAIRAATGARSIASPTSIVLQAAKQTIILIFPTMQTGGSHWVLWATQHGLGGVGLHYRLPVMGALQIAESAIQRTVTDAVTTSDTTLTSPTAVFSASDAGKQVALSGGGALTTTIATYVSPTQVTLTAPATWSSSGNTAVITAIVPSAATRTVTDAVTNSTSTVTSPTAVFSAADVDRQVVLSGGGNLTTTIATYVSPTEVTLTSAPGWTSAGNTMTIADVTGTARAIEIEFQDSDLIDEIAWTDDYPPPAGTHPGTLEAVTMVGGCYSDATSDPTSTSPGTCMAISLRNFPESFKPSHLLYFPSALLSMKGRSTDSFKYVACDGGSLHAVIYTGATDGPACSVVTPWPDVGPANPHGWAQVFNNVYAAIGNGNFARIGPNNEVDTSFADAVAEQVKDWDPRYTIVEHHPNTKCVVFSNGSEGWAFNYSTGGWSSLLGYSDWATGSAISAVMSQNLMKLTMNQNGTHRLYTWNVGSATTCIATSQWFDTPEPGRAKTIREVMENIQSDTAVTVHVAIHRNFRQVYAKDAYIASASSNLQTVTPFFNTSDVGKYVIVLGAGSAGSPLFVRIGTYVSATSVNLVSSLGDFAGAAAQTASTTVTSANPAYMLIAQDAYLRTQPRTGFQLFKPKRRKVRECYAYAVSVVLRTAATDAQVVGVELKGTVNLQQGGVVT